MMTWLRENQEKLTIGVGLLFALGVLVRFPDHLNGAYWRWVWLETPLWSAFLFLAAPLPVFFLALHWIQSDLYPGPRPGFGVRRILIALGVACFGFQICGILVEGAAFEKMIAIVESARATSYYTDALAIQNVFQFLREFPELELNMHSSTHPPGPILYHYMFIRLFSTGLAPVVGGICIAVLASFTVPMVFVLAGLWTEDVKERLTIAAYMAILPGLIVFLPEFDQAYPLVSMGMLLFWERALRRGGLNFVFFGLVLFAACLAAYNLLVIGLFLALLALYAVYQAEPRGPELRRIILGSLSAIVVVIVLFLLLYAGTGYNPVLAFRKALAWQAAHQARPHLYALVLDPYDFALGAGMMIVPLLAYYALAFVPARTEPVALLNENRGLVLSLAGFATILFVHLVGLLDYETARVWLFFQPFVLIPAGRILRNFDRPYYFAFFGVQWLVLAALKSQMTFIDP